MILNAQKFTIVSDGRDVKRANQNGAQKRINVK